MKKLKVLVFVLVANMMGITSLACETLKDEDNYILEYATNSEFDLCDARYLAVCPGGLKHEMDGIGPASLIVNGETVFSVGYATQCKNCYETVISENSPYYHVYLGWYSTYNPGYKLYGEGVVLYTNVKYYNSNLANDPFFDVYLWL